MVVDAISVESGSPQKGDDSPSVAAATPAIADAERDEQSIVLHSHVRVSKHVCIVDRNHVGDAVCFGPAHEPEQTAPGVTWSVHPADTVMSSVEDVQPHDPKHGAISKRAKGKDKKHLVQVAPKARAHVPSAGKLDDAQAAGQHPTLMLPSHSEPYVLNGLKRSLFANRAAIGRPTCMHTIGRPSSGSGKSASTARLGTARWPKQRSTAIRQTSARTHC